MLCAAKSCRDDPAAAHAAAACWRMPSTLSTRRCVMQGIQPFLDARTKKRIRFVMPKDKDEQQVLPSRFDGLLHMYSRHTGAKISVQEQPCPAATLFSSHPAVMRSQSAALRACVIHCQAWWNIDWRLELKCSRSLHTNCTIAGHMQAWGHLRAGHHTWWQSERLLQPRGV